MRARDRARWDRVEAALTAALEVPTGERSGLLDRICFGEAELRQEVESLLAAHRRTGSPLDSSLDEFAAPLLAELPELEASEDVGRVVGRYRLVEEIGRGGMGTVWLAERADGQFDQRVALKLIQRGMESEATRGRFLRERQILARLTHAHIARLLDGGVSEDGRPYFVMELVSGVPITRYCENRRLSRSQRLLLFGAVCRAVQYAHQNLIVHRDLKPSNVLVTEAGEVKLLDFGVATLLGEDSETTPVRGPMTPEYASPEQLKGLPISTASDLYQLGVLLHELLCGRRPGRDAALGSGLQGDLAAIVDRALQPEPARRYPSPEALAQDVDRHLAHRPLLLAAERWSSRGRKFLRRNRGRLAGAVALGIAAAVLGVVYLQRIRTERDRALHEAAKSAQSAALLERLFWGYGPNEADRREINAEKLLGDATRRAEAELGNDPETLAAVLSVLGDLHSSVGRNTVADSLLRRARAVQERLPPALSLDLALTLGRQGRLLRLEGRCAQGVPLLSRAQELLLTQLPPERTEVLGVQLDLANCLQDLARDAEAERLFRDGLTKAGVTTPLGTEFASDLGYVLFVRTRYDEAEALLRPTLERQRQVFGPLHISSIRTTRKLASVLRDQGKLAEAEALNREALEQNRILFGLDHPETTTAMLTLTVVLEREGKLGEAEALIRTALKRTGPQVAAVVREMVGSLASILVARGKLAEAEPLLRQTLARLRAEGRAGDEGLGDQLNRLAWCLAQRGAPDAEAVYREAVAFESARPAAGPFFVTDGYQYLGELARRHHDRALAERMFRRAIALYQRQLPAGHPYRIMAERGLKLLI